MPTFSHTKVKVRIPDERAALRAVGGALWRNGEIIASESRERHVPVADGTLRSSINVTQPQITGNKVEVTVYAGGPAAKYAFFVHEGTLPHWVPIEPLKEWAKKVLGDENAAYAIQQKIAMYGTKARKYLEIPWRARLPKIEGSIQKSLAKLKKKDST